MAEIFASLCHKKYLFWRLPLVGHGLYSSKTEQFLIFAQEGIYDDRSLVFFFPEVAL